MINKYPAAILSAFLLFSSINAQQVVEFKNSNHYFTMPVNIAPDDYLSNTVVLKVKPQFRSDCSVNTIENHPSLTTFLRSIGAYNLEKIFPRHTQPERESDNLGHKYADLSLIYSFQYMSNTSLEKVINILYSLGLFEYVELKVLPKTCAVFTPNDPNVSQQYSITQLRADSAWGINTTTARGDTNVVIGITDTGIEYTHSDLGNIKFNYADPVNGTDDDGDGYIDNFRGWDLGMNDNDATWQAQDHGVHVSGIAGARTNNSNGMAGIGFNCKLLPIKIANSAGQLAKAYEGIVYGADHGCKVINCSWGGTVITSLGLDAVTYATINKNVLVVAAAGNNASPAFFYPASYKYVICVAGLTSSNAKWAGSNYGYSVDVCTGGQQIYGTISGNSYTNQDGTSMACPNASGSAALIRSYYPHFTALQAGEQLRVSSDSARLYAANNIVFKERLGKGVVNLYKALTDTSRPAVVTTNRADTDNNDDSYVAGDTIHMTGTFTNYLGPTTNLTATLTEINSSGYITIVDGTASLGVINKMANKDNSIDPFLVKVNGSAPLNSVINFKLTLRDGNYTTVEYFDLTVNVDYINIAINDVATTVTSKGLIGYNKETQQEGFGFKYKNGSSILYEAALMIGSDTGKVSDAARSTGTTPDSDFVSTVRVRKLPNVHSDFDVDGSFNDNFASTPLNLLVHHSEYAWASAGNTKFVMFKYVIKNNGGTTLSNLYAGIFADWDIDAVTYRSNRAGYDAANKLGYVYYTATGGIYGGVKVLSSNAPTLNYAFDNVAGGAGGIEISNGYSSSEKYNSMSTNRTAAGTSGSGEDVMHTVSTGPFTITAGDSIVVGFALLAGDSLPDMKTSAQNAQLKWDTLTAVGSGTVSAVQVLSGKTFSSVNIYPNPASGQATIVFTLNDKATVDLSLLNIIGQEVKHSVFGTLSAGKHQFNLDMNNLPEGIYYYRLTSGENISINKLVISK